MALRARPVLSSQIVIKSGWWTRVAVAVLLGVCGCDGGSPSPDAAHADAAALPDARAPDAAIPPDAGPMLAGFSLDEWRACPGAPASATYRCAVLTTPIDWSRPDGPTIRRPVRRYPATGVRRGVLFWNPGGPGAATFPQRILGGVPEIVAAYDLLSLDWRGVGASDRLLSCPRPASTEIFIYQTTTGALAESMERALELQRTVAADCLAAVDPLLLEHVGSEDMARDLEAMRILLGEERLSFVGFSYGTVLGATYARLFPDRVDAFVLDSPIHPSLEWLADQEAQIVSQEAAFDRFLAWCVRLDCAFAQGRDEPALGDALDAIVEELLARPRFAVGPTGAENVVGASMFLGWMVETLSSPPAWPRLGQSLRDMENGNFIEITRLFSEAGMTNDLGYDLIRHADRPFLERWDAADGAEHFLARILPMAPHSGYTFLGRLGGALAMAEVPSEPLVLAAPDAPPVLVIGGRHDTQTPYPGALAMRDAVGRGSHLVTYEGDGHAISDAIPCLRAEVVRFLLDPSRAPTVTSCAALEVTP